MPKLALLLIILSSVVVILSQTLEERVKALEASVQALQSSCGNINYNITDLQLQVSSLQNCTKCPPAPGPGPGPSPSCLPTPEDNITDNDVLNQVGLNPTIDINRIKTAKRVDGRAECNPIMIKILYAKALSTDFHAQILSNNNILVLYNSNRSNYGTVTFHTSYPTVILARSDGTVYSGDNSGLIYVWSAKDLGLITSLKGHVGGISSMMSLNTHLIFSGSSNGKIYALDKDQFDLVNYNKVYELVSPSNSTVTGLFKIDPCRIVAAHRDGTIEIWDILSKKIISAFNHTGFTSILKVEAPYFVSISGADVSVWSYKDNQLKLIKTNTVGGNRELTTLGYINRDYVFIGAFRGVLFWNWKRDETGAYYSSPLPVTWTERIDNQTIAVTTGCSMLAGESLTYYGY